MWTLWYAPVSLRLVLVRLRLPPISFCKISHCVPSGSRHCTLLQYSAKYPSRVQTLPCQYQVIGKCPLKKIFSTRLHKYHISTSIQTTHRHLSSIQVTSPTPSWRQRSKRLILIPVHSCVLTLIIAASSPLGDIPTALSSAATSRSDFTKLFS